LRYHFWAARGGRGGALRARAGQWCAATRGLRFEDGARYYRFTCDGPIALTAANRGDRQRGMEQAASFYLQRLHEMVKAHPEQWQGLKSPFLAGETPQADRG